MIHSDKYLGCFLGLAIGDAYGAPFEGGPIERLLWKAIGKTRDGKIRYTDDTQMSIDVASSFIQNSGVDQDHLAATFARNYKWSRGYGPSAAWLLKKINGGAGWQDVNRAKFNDGSFGNGAAMRAPIVALCFPDDEARLSENVAKTSEITHAHPLAIEGAKLIAFVTHAALHDWNTEAILQALPSRCTFTEYQTKVAFCIDSVQAPHAVEAGVLQRSLGNGIAASQSCVTAIYFALAYRSRYDAMLDQICKLGGDADTIAAMAGAIWGAFNGYSALDQTKTENIEDSSEIAELAKQLHAMSFSNAIQ